MAVWDLFDFGGVEGISAIEPELHPDVPVPRACMSSAASVPSFLAGAAVSLLHHL